MRRRTLALGTLLTALAWPTSAAATTTTIALGVNYTPFVCLNVTLGTTSATGSVAAPDGTVLETLVPQPPVATACAGGAGRSILLLEPSPRLSGVEGLTLRTQGNDDPTAFSFRIPITRADPESGATGITHLLALPTASTVNAVATAGPSADITGTPALTIVFPVGAATVTVSTSPNRLYFYSNSRGGQTTVQLNSPAPGIPVTVELRLPDGTLVASRAVPVQIDGRVDFQTFDGALPSGSTVRIVQAGIADRTRRFGDATFTGDGFRAALPAAPACTATTCPEGRFFVGLALHGETTTVTDPLGPCQTLAYLGTLPSECAPLVTPRTSVTATGLLAVGADYLEVETSWPIRDKLSITASQRGGAVDLDTGFVYLGGVSEAPLTGTITLPGTGGLQLTRTLGATGAGDGGLFFDGATGFPVHIPSGTTGVFSGPALGAAPQSALFALTASIEGNDVTGRAAPGARIRITRTPPAGLPPPDAVGTAGGDGSFRIAIGATATGTLVRVSAGDPVTRALTQLGLVAGRAHIAIAGASDRQVVRGTISLTATGGVEGPASWRVGVASSVATVAPWAHAVDTRTYPDGPLKASVRDAAVGDYLYLIVDNTAPSGGAGSDQTVRPRRDALILTEARDANGLASVAADFGDGVKLAQPASQLGQPLHHAYAKVGSYKATVTITDAAGNVTTDSAAIKVRSAAAPKLSGTIPASASRTKPLRLTLRSSAAGTLTVRLISPRGRAVRTAVKRIAKAGGKVSISFATKTLRPGRYLLLRQLVSDDGTPGAILTRSVTIR